jgi:hypothetical protein
MLKSNAPEQIHTTPALIALLLTRRETELCTFLRCELAGDAAVRSFTLITQRLNVIPFPFLAGELTDIAIVINPHQQFT